MLIKSLTMKNFRQFKGTQSIEFSCDKERNVTVILGSNTSGKTTLLQAFNWCLYGFAVFKTKGDMLNMELALDMNVGDSEEVSVEICLIHNNMEYTITRTQEYTYQAKGVRPGPLGLPVITFRQTDGQTKRIRDTYVNKTINEILPQELSSYFFFDAERIGSITSKSDVTDSVKGLLGLSILQNAMNHLKGTSRNNVIAKFKASMDLEGNRKATQALARIQSLQENLNIINEQLTTAKNEKKHYEARKEQLDGILRDNRTTAQLQRKKETTEEAIRAEEKALEQAYDRFFSSFNTNTTCFFAQPLMARALELLKDAQVDDKGLSDITAQTIDEIVERGVCVCGAKIIKGNEAYRCLMEERRFVPPQSFGTSIRNFRANVDIYRNAGESYHDSLRGYFQDIYRYRNRIQEWRDEVSHISDEIKGKEDMKRYEEELMDVKRRLKEFDDKIENFVREDERCRREIENYQKVYDGSVVATEQNKRIAVYIAYAEEVYDWISTTYREKEQQIRDVLESRVNNIFAKMYHGQRQVVIDEKYRVSLLTTHIDEKFHTDESTGLENVKNFAFVAGLMDMARDKIASKVCDDSLELGSEPYPLVMDAPFSPADGDHISNICRVLPGIAEQVIMFIMQKDWSFAEIELGDLVGSEYRLDKKSETLTYIREVKRHV